MGVAGVREQPSRRRFRPFRSGGCGRRARRCAGPAAARDGGPAPGPGLGLVGAESVTLDYPALGRRRDAVVEKHVKGVEFLMKKNKVTMPRCNGAVAGPTGSKVNGG